MMNWKEYQNEVAEIFNSIGAETKVEHTVEGVRGKHKIDVWAKLQKFGIEMTWICECKYWNTAIPKDKVLTLYEITKDIGADKGFLFSESGFQSGAIRACNKTNILLTSIEETSNLIKEELEENELVFFLKEFENIKSRMKVSWIDDLGNPTPLNDTNFDESILIDGTLMFLTLKIQSALNNNYPLIINGLNSKSVKCENAKDLITLLNSILKECKKVESKTLKAIESKHYDIDKLKSEFIESAENLIRSTENQLFTLQVDFENATMETIKWLKLTGVKADELKKVSRGSFSNALSTTMRTLIDEIYPHMTESEMDKKLWDLKKTKAIKQISIMNKIDKY